MFGAAAGGYVRRIIRPEKARGQRTGSSNMLKGIVPVVG